MPELPVLLVVDDAPENLALVSRLLRAHYQVHTADDAVRALASAAEEKPDLVLLDILMPVMDGFETFRRLRQDPATRDVPVIFLSAKDDPEAVIEGLRLGAADYIVKPFNARELKARVDNIIDLNRRHKQLETLLQERTRELQKTADRLSAAQAEAEIKHWVRQLRLVTPSRVRYLAPIRDHLNACYAAACRQHDVNRLNLDLCLSEALANAVIHGNLEVPSSLKQDDWTKFDALLAERESDPAYAERTVSVSYERSEDRLSFVIADQGRGFDPSGLPDPNDPAAMLSSGRGLLLIRSFMDEVSWNDTGNAIVMAKNLS